MDEILIRAEDARSLSKQSFEKLRQLPYVADTIKLIDDLIQKSANSGATECVYYLGSVYDVQDTHNTDGLRGLSLFKTVARAIKDAGFAVSLQPVQGNAVFQLNISWD